MARLTTPRIVAIAVSLVITLFLFLILGVLQSRGGPGGGLLSFSIFGLVAIVIQVLFWAGIIALGIWLARESGILKSAQGPDSNEDALAVLRRRYASGDISRSEYFQVKEDLEAER